MIFQFFSFQTTRTSIVSMNETRTRCVHFITRTISKQDSIALKICQQTGGLTHYSSFHDSKPLFPLFIFFITQCLTNDLFSVSTNGWKRHEEHEKPTSMFSIPQCAALFCGKNNMEQMVFDTGLLKKQCPTCGAESTVKYFLSRPAPIIVFLQHGRMSPINDLLF